MTEEQRRKREIRPVGKLIRAKLARIQAQKEFRFTNGLLADGLILDHEPLFANDRHLVFQTSGESVARVREEAPRLPGIEHQPRFAAEAGECAYFRVFSNFRIAAPVIGPWLRNCPCRETKKVSRISA
jgi:hypothetical protein